MPRRPPSPCTSPACRALVPGGGRCPEHKPKDTRPSASSRGYDRAWSEFSKAFLAAHPCCQEPGCSRPSVHVDHIDGLGPKGPRGKDPSNCRALCKPHHSRKTALYDGGFGRPKATRPDAGGVG